MAYTDIDKPTDYFNTVLYVGNNSTNVITGVGFQPDFVWLKDRVNANSHNVYDVVRGTTKALLPNLTNAEVTRATGLTSFDSDGFTLGSYGGHNESSGNVAWNWLASNTTASNTDGSITSTVSANTTSGFSIVSYTGNGSTNQSVGHGLSQAPEILITKGRTNSQNWAVYGSVIGVDKRLYLNTTDTADTLSGYLPADTSSVINLSGTSSMSNINTSSIDYITYAFHSVKGYSKIGSYTGNGNADGTFIYTGFKPAMVIIKKTNSTSNWVIFDNKRGAYNSNSPELQPNTSSAEASVTDRFDFVSNGIKFTSSSFPNGSGNSFIYMTFAESPFVTSTGIPTVAR